MNMKIIFFILFSSIFGFSYSQTVLLNEDFESYQDFTISNIGSWQTLDLDLLNTLLEVRFDDNNTIVKKIIKQ